MTVPHFEIEIDHEADAAYITIDQDDPVANTKELDRYRILDFAGDGRLVGIELLRVSSGVSLSGLPFAKELEPLFTSSGIKYR